MYKVNSKFEDINGNWPLQPITDINMRILSTSIRSIDDDLTQMLWFPIEFLSDENFLSRLYDF